MLFKKKKFDEYGYAIDEIVWGNIIVGDTFYNMSWRFFISFIEKDTNKTFELDLTKFLNKQETKHPRKLKKELLTLMKGQNVKTCLQILVERFPDATDYIYKKLPKSLIETANIEPTIIEENINTL